MLGYFLSAFDGETGDTSMSKSSGFLASEALKKKPALSSEEMAIYSMLYTEGSQTFSSLVINVELESNIINSALEKLIRKKLIKTYSNKLRNSKEVIFSPR